MGEDNPDALIGATVADKYRIEALLGRGGMGSVYRATHTGIGKRVALKFLDIAVARDRDSVLRFQREAEAASAVESAHIVHIFDSGQAPSGAPFLVMELLTGEDLRSLLVRQGKLPLDQALHVASQVLRGLARAHAAGIVHRDLKPDNVFLCRHDDDPMFVKLVDFGISKVAKRDDENALTRRGTVLGTASYMSPEQAQAFADIDGRTDLFSLGAILFEMLAGRPPHTGPAYEPILIDICTKDAPDIRRFAPDVPEAVAQVIAKALARDRDARYPSASDLHDALALAAPDLLPHSGGPSGPRPVLSTLPERDSRSDAAEVQRTAEGTAVRPAAPARAQTLRTAVLIVTVALGAFAVTVLLLRRPAADPVRPAASDSRPAAPVSTATLEPVATQPSPSASATDVPEPPASSSAAPRPKLIGTRAAPPPSATAPVPTQKPATGVASGLQLETSGP